MRSARAFGCWRSRQRGHGLGGDAQGCNRSAVGEHMADLGCQIVAPVWLADQLHAGIEPPAMHDTEVTRVLESASKLSLARSTRLLSIAIAGAARVAPSQARARASAWQSRRGRGKKDAAEPGRVMSVAGKNENRANSRGACLNHAQQGDANSKIFSDRVFCKYGWRTELYCLCRCTTHFSEWSWAPPLTVHAEHRSGCELAPAKSRPERVFAKNDRLPGTVRPGDAARRS